MTALKALIWLYLFFLLFEGALRKWILPGLSSPLLLVRDPIVIAIYLLAAGSGLFPRSGFLAAAGILAAVAAVFALLAERFDLGVFLFGMRTNFLHLPLIFVMARIFDSRDVLRVGKCFLVLSLPMAYLVMRQFQASPDDFINLGAGVGGRQIVTSGGKIRASGTFSFVSGIIAFYALVAAFLLHSLMTKKIAPVWLQVAGGIGLVAAVATSGSRSALVGVALVGGGLVFVLLRSPKLIGRAILTILSLGAVAGVVLQSGVVGEGVEIMTARFEDAGGHAGFWPRIGEILSGPLYETFSAPLFGVGLGYGTNAGAALVTGSVDFLLAENEWSRLVQESGPIAGNLFILWRIGLVLWLARISLAAARVGNFLPFLLLTSCANLLVTGQFGQATTLGFAVFGGGLCLAAIDQGGAENGAPPADEQSESETSDRQEQARRGKRGRSAYAEALHTG